MPDSFASKTYDHEFGHSDHFHVIACTSSKLGPAILAHVKLKNLVNYDGSSGILSVRNATCCASVEFYNLMDSKQGMYAEMAKITNLSMMSGSCHPGSHFVIPNAPHLTALLQYAQAPEMNSNRTILIDYMTPDEAEKLFPTCRFDKNTGIDQYISRCVISPKVLLGKVLGGLGMWSKPYIAFLRRNFIRMEGRSYEQWRIDGENEVLRNEGQEDDGPSEEGRGSSDSVATRGEIRGEGHGDLVGGSSRDHEGSQTTP
jgi:hypothetical protein